MKQYLIALDMDGTLLRSDQTISNNTVNVIKRLVQLGHKVVIASGRPLDEIKQYAQRWSQTINDLNSESTTERYVDIFQAFGNKTIYFQ